MRTIVRKRWYFIPPLILAALAAFGFITMILWNALLPGIFHLSEITFWQAVGLLILSRIFFSGGPNHHGGHPWMNRMRGKWEKMTPEEREQFRQQWPNHLHNWGSCCGDNKSQERKTDSTM